MKEWFSKPCIYTLKNHHTFWKLLYLKIEHPFLIIALYSAQYISTNLPSPCRSVNCWKYLNNSNKNLFPISPKINSEQMFTTKRSDIHRWVYLYIDITHYSNYTLIHEVKSDADWCIYRCDVYGNMNLKLLRIWIIIIRKIYLMNITRRS